jgi:hypothetical protein
MANRLTDIKNRLKQAAPGQRIITPVEIRAGRMPVIRAEGQARAPFVPGRPVVVRPTLRVDPAEAEFIRMAHEDITWLVDQLARTRDLLRAYVKEIDGAQIGPGHEDYEEDDPNSPVFQHDDETILWGALGEFRDQAKKILKDIEE